MPSELFVQQKNKAKKSKFKVIKVKPSDPVEKTVGRCIRDFKAKFNGTDLWKNIQATRAISRLQSRCTWAHEQLAVVPFVEIELDYLHAGKDYRCKVARDNAYASDSDWSQCRKTDQAAPDQDPGDQWGVHNGDAPNHPLDEADDTFSEVSSPEEPLG
jgi:hypothetical protein